jgi:hypothetical protein
VLKSPREAEDVSQFWRRQIGNLAMRYPRFSQEHTYLTVQVIQGLEKFPIQYWNNPGEKLGLALKDLSVASFFFKSAYKVLESQRLNLYGPGAQAGGNDTSAQGGKGRESIPGKESQPEAASTEGLLSKHDGGNKASDG